MRARSDTGSRNTHSLLQAPLTANGRDVRALISNSPNNAVDQIQCPVRSTVAPAKFSVVTSFPFDSERTYVTSIHT